MIGIGRFTRFEEDDEIGDERRDAQLMSHPIGGAG
jgi:hypothetical protein